MKSTAIVSQDANVRLVSISPNSRPWAILKPKSCKLTDGLKLHNESVYNKQKKKNEKQKKQKEIKGDPVRKKENYRIKIYTKKK